MKKINNLIGGTLFSSIVFLTSCGENSNKETLKNTSEYNIIASVENPAAMLSMDLIELLDKSKLKESKEIPAQYKTPLVMILDQNLNSDNQGFKIEGNIPLIVSASADNKFNYAMSTVDVIDAEKIGSSLAVYVDGHVEKNDNNSTLEFQYLTFTGCFAWDNKKLVVVLSEDKDNKSIAQQLLTNQNTDAKDNQKIKAFLAEDNDFRSLLFMDTYTEMANKLSETKMDDELAKAYEGMTISTKGNFNNGSFVFESNLDGENFINSEFNNLNEVPVSKDFTHFLSENGKLIGFGTASLNLDAIVKTMNHTHNEQGDYDKELAKMGLTKEDITEVFDGNFSFSLIDIESVPTPGYENNPAFNEEKPKFLLTCGIKEASKLKALLDSNAAIKAVENCYIADETYMALTENKLFISLNDSLIKKLSNGEQFPAFDATLTTPLYGTIVTNMDDLPMNYKNILLRNGGEEVLKFYNEIESIEFSGDIHHTTFTIKLNDKNTNSLEIFSNTIIKNALPFLPMLMSSMI